MTTNKCQVPGWTWLGNLLRSEEGEREIVRRMRGGVGLRMDDRHIQGLFTGHPVHVWEAGEWQPITLQLQGGRVHGSRFGWRDDGAVLCDGRPLHLTRGILVNGERRILGRPIVDGNTIKREAGRGMSYQIRFTEAGVKEELLIEEPMEGEIGFDIQGKSKVAGISENPMTAWEDTGARLTCLPGNKFILRPGMAYPVMIDPDYAADSADAGIEGHSTSYGTARSTSTSIYSSTYFYVGQQVIGMDFYVERGFLKFLTADIPDVIITQANIKLVCTTDASTTDFDVQIVKQDWSSQDPIDAGNRETAYDNCLAGTADDNIWRNTSGISINTVYTSGNLSTTWVVTTAPTYYSLRSSRDYSNTSPTGDELIAIASQDHGTAGYRPLLAVTWAFTPKVIMV